MRTSLPSGGTRDRVLKSGAYQLFSLGYESMILRSNCGGPVFLLNAPAGKLWKSRARPGPKGTLYFHSFPDGTLTDEPGRPSGGFDVSDVHDQIASRRVDRLMFLEPGPGFGGTVFLTDTSFLRWPGLRNGCALQGKGPRLSDRCFEGVKPNQRDPLRDDQIRSKRPARHSTNGRP